MVQIKVYAFFTPATLSAFTAVSVEKPRAISLEGEEWLFFEGETLSISFEGLYFPVHEVLEALARTLPCEAMGKLDELRIDDWELHRHVFTAGHFVSNSQNLNYVLEHSCSHS